MSANQTAARLRGVPEWIYFLNRASKALRASPGLRGAGPFAGEGAGAEGEASRATVTRGSNNVHSLALSFTAILTGMGFKH